MDTKVAGKLGGLKGGLSKSVKKRRAVRKNLAIARQAKHSKWLASTHYSVGDLVVNPNGKTERIAAAGRTKG